MESQLGGREALVMGQLFLSQEALCLCWSTDNSLTCSRDLQGKRPLPSTDSGEFCSAVLCRSNLMAGTHWDASGLFMEVVITTR